MGGWRGQGAVTGGKVRKKFCGSRKFLLVGVYGTRQSVRSGHGFSQDLGCFHALLYGPCFRWMLAMAAGRGSPLPASLTRRRRSTAGFSCQATDWVSNSVINYSMMHVVVAVVMAVTRKSGGGGDWCLGGSGRNVDFQTEIGAGSRLLSGFSSCLCCGPRLWMDEVNDSDGILIPLIDLAMLHLRCVSFRAIQNKRPLHLLP